jgi:hypothetical protein
LLYLAMYGMLVVGSVRGGLLIVRCQKMTYEYFRNCSVSCVRNDDRSQTAVHFRNCSSLKSRCARLPKQ